MERSSSHLERLLCERLSKGCCNPIEEWFPVSRSSNDNHQTRKHLVDIIRLHLIIGDGGPYLFMSLLGDHTALSDDPVVERLFHCDKTLYDKCSQTYPELAVGFSF